MKTLNANGVDEERKRADLELWTAERPNFGLTEWQRILDAYLGGTALAQAIANERATGGGNDTAEQGPTARRKLLDSQIAAFQAEHPGTDYVAALEATTGVQVRAR